VVNKVKIGIYNGKEKTAGAFTNTMSLSQAHGIASNGFKAAIVTHSIRCETRLFPEDYFYENIEDIHDIKTTNPIKALSAFDWVIWNSYRSEDLEILKAIKRQGVRITKSFPRFFSNTERDITKINSRLDQFDFVAFALKSDASFSISLDISPERAEYVPRGFISKLLNSEKNHNRLQICVDGPVRPNSVDKTEWNPSSTIEELIKALKMLKSKFPEINLISSRVELGIEGSTRLKSLPTKDFYRNFF
jgi:hypothetical protein